MESLSFSERETTNEKSRQILWTKGVQDVVTKSENSGISVDGSEHSLAGTLMDSSAEEQYLAQMERVELLRILHAQPDPYREVLYLRIFGNLSFREIGDIMGKSENWARVTFYRGKGQLKKEVEKNE